MSATYTAYVCERGHVYFEAGPLINEEQELGILQGCPCGAPLLVKVSHEGNDINSCREEGEKLVFLEFATFSQMIQLDESVDGDGVPHKEYYVVSRQVPKYDVTRLKEELASKT